MKHSIDGVLPKETITIYELENTVEIICKNRFSEPAETGIQLDLKSLHSFIGTLLHVQRRFKPVF